VVIGFNRLVRRSVQLCQRCRERVGATDFRPLSGKAHDA
jgi:hypothetical protein